MYHKNTIIICLKLITSVYSGLHAVMLECGKGLRS